MAKRSGGITSESITVTQSDGKSTTVTGGPGMVERAAKRAKAGLRSPLDDIKGEGFNPAVSNRLRWVNANRLQWKAELKDWKEQAKLIKEEIDSLGEQEKKKRDNKHQELGQVVMTCEHLGDNIKWADETISVTIAQADQPEMFDIDEKPMPPGIV